MYIRTIITYIFIIMLTVLEGLVAYILLLFSKDKKKLIYRGMKFYGFCSTKIIKWIGGVDVQIRGEQNIHEGSFIYASIHQSMADIVILSAIINNPAYILKKELLRVPIVGYYIGICGMIPISRSQSVKDMRVIKEQTSRLIVQKRSLIIFPQGTRQVPKEPLQLKRGLEMIYTHMNVPVIPIVLNTGSYINKNGFIFKKGTITVSFLPPIEAGLDKKTLMQTLHENLQQELNNIQ